MCYCELYVCTVTWSMEAVLPAPYLGAAIVAVGGLCALGPVPQSPMANVAYASVLLVCLQWCLCKGHAMAHVSPQGV